MAIKQVELSEVGLVTLYKRKGAKHIRLSITSTGKVRVTLPTWVPYSAGIAFAKQKQSWIIRQKPPVTMLHNGMRIGQSHQLLFGTDPSRHKVATRLMKNGAIIVKIPPGNSINDETIQTAALKACIRALKNEAESVLPGRLREMAVQHGFSFHSVEVKYLKSRWGSCDNQQRIVLNCFLMQLPWHLIDYVLLHELMHTKIMTHGTKFWSALDEHVPDLAKIRKQIRSHQPTVRGILGEEL